MYIHENGARALKKERKKEKKEKANAGRGKRIANAGRGKRKMRFPNAHIQ